MVRVPVSMPREAREAARLERLLAELKRIPAHRRVEECADERTSTVVQMLHFLKPPVYAWTTDDDEIAEDAIIVGIGGTSTAMIAAGLTYVEPAASIYWCARLTEIGVFEAGGEPGPWDVPTALLRARVLQERMGYERVVVTLEEIGMWRRAWGKLKVQEGF